jgi:hypothetical protein
MDVNNEAVCSLLAQPTQHGLERLPDASPTANRVSRCRSTQLSYSCEPSPERPAT